MFCFIILLYFKAQSRLLLKDLDTFFFRFSALDLPTGQCNSAKENIKYGYLPVPNGIVSFIYYHNNPTYQNIVYINGGPGMSSQISNFLEVGPNSGKWNQFSNILFLDLPAGSGYGINNATELTYDDVAKDYIQAMNQFKTLCKIEMKNVYLFSSDFGSRFALSIANVDSNVQTVVLLDPFLDTIGILSEIPNYGFHMGILDWQERQYYERAMIQLNDYIFQNEYEASLGSIFSSLKDSIGGMSLYNIMKVKSYADEEDELQNNLNNIESSLYIEFETDFIARSGDVYYLFEQEFYKPYDDEIIINVLKSKQVLIIQSQYDLLIPPSSTLKWLTSLNYELSNYFYYSNLTKLLVDEQLGGFLKNGGNLKYIVVLECGQVMQRDQNYISTEIIKQYMNNIL